MADSISPAVAEDKHTLQNVSPTGTRAYHGAGASGVCVRPGSASFAFCILHFELRSPNPTVRPI